MPQDRTPQLSFNLSRRLISIFLVSVLAVYTAGITVTLRLRRSAMQDWQAAYTAQAADFTDQLNTELLLFTLLLNVRREIFAEQLGEEPARDTACFDLFNAYLRSGAATQLEMLHRFTDLCAETCRQREENETHSTQAIIKRINRYIEDNVENYDLSLTALARMTGFNPSYLSRFYRINTGKKLSDQIDEAKLQHAKKLIAQGELVKNVAERTGFASPSAFILFFKRNTGVTPRQYFESENKS